LENILRYVKTLSIRELSKTTVEDAYGLDTTKNSAWKIEEYKKQQ
jgi:hypothetical protein